MILDFDTAIQEYHRIQRDAPDLLLFATNPRFWDQFPKMSDINAKYPNKCPTCGCLPGERGFVRMDWPIGHKYFGAAIRCPRCNGRRG